MEELLIEDFARKVAKYLFLELAEKPIKRTEISAAEPLLTLTEAAAYLKITRQTIHNYMRAGKLTPIRKVPGGKPWFSIAELRKLPKP